MAASRFRWDSTAPLGAPVVPEVKQIRAGSSGAAASIGPGSPSGRSSSGWVTTTGPAAARRTHAAWSGRSTMAADGLDVGDDVGQLPLRVRGVGRHHHQAGPEGPDVGHQGGHRRRGRPHHPVPGHQARPPEPAGGPAGGLVEFAGAPPPAGRSGRGGDPVRSGEGLQPQASPRARGPSVATRPARGCPPRSGRPSSGPHPVAGGPATGAASSPVRDEDPPAPARGPHPPLAAGAYVRHGSPRNEGQAG